MNPKYDPTLVAWMEKELADIGVKPLKSSGDVEAFMKDTTGTTMVVINSVCGCAAGGARPGVGMALQNGVIPDRMATVFAGVDKEVTEKVRSYMKDVQPSSPSVAIFKDGELVRFLPRHEIEGFSHDEISEKLVNAFDNYCTAEGPSVPMDELQKAFSSKQRMGMR
ncbi:MAG: BrxA/BrxB family bacilliredoxin [Calditrichaeota bacterium]|nr:MAG: BrxA/BrxB family bacilliredoxin [Calditrichota bacterium]